MVFAPKVKNKQQDNEEKNELNDEEKDEVKEISLDERNKQCEDKKQALMGRIEKWEKQNQE